MRVSAILCFILAAVSTVAAIGIAKKTLETREFADAVGVIVGAFLLPMIFLIGGLSLARKPEE